MKPSLKRARAKLNDLGGKRARLQAMDVTEEELGWWAQERRRHRRTHALRVGLPWFLAYAAGGLLHDERWRHFLPALGIVLISAVAGSLMSFVMWRSLEVSVNLRELRGRRLRQALLSDADPAAESHEREPVRLVAPVGGDVASS